MKILRILATIASVLGGIALLCMPSKAQGTKAAAGSAFVPTRFTVVDAGTVGKPDIVLIPGLASARAVWDGEAKLLAPNYRLHLVQINGFAGAPAGANADGPMLPGVVEELHGYIAAGKMHPVMMGHSLGGLLTLMLAQKYPGDAVKLIIVDALPFYGVVFDANATVDSLAAQAKVVHDQLLAAPDDQFAAMQPMMVKTMVNSDEGAKAVVAASIASDRRVFANAVVEDMSTDVRGEMGKIKMPVLMLYPYDAAATKDVAKIDAVYEGAYGKMPNVKLVRIDDSRHFIMYDQPAKMDAAVEAFLK